MTTVILYMWVIVAAGSSFTSRDWRNMGEFTTVATCTEAARQLGVTGSNFRCVPK